MTHKTRNGVFGLREKNSGRQRRKLMSEMRVDEILLRYAFRSAARPWRESSSGRLVDSVDVRHDTTLPPWDIASGPALNH